MPIGKTRKRGTLSTLMGKPPSKRRKKSIRKTRAFKQGRK